MKALEIKNLSKTFVSNFLINKARVLTDINLQVNRGEIYGFLGPNGAGKTTTIKCILKLIFSDSGDILIFGEPNHKIATRECIGYLPENPYFYDYLTVKELLVFNAQLYSVPKKQARERAMDLIRLVGLSGKDNVKLKKFSKGMIQRAGLAQAMINDPDLLILDEPFSGLDPIGRKELRDIILQLKQSGKTIFFSSHILQDMELIVDTVGIIVQGKIIKEGRLSNLISHSIESYEVVCEGLEEAVLLKAKIEAVKKDGQFFLRTENPLQVNTLIKTLQKTGGKIVSVTPVRMTLEDIFIKETKA